MFTCEMRTLAHGESSRNVHMRNKFHRITASFNNGFQERGGQFRWGTGVGLKSGRGYAIARVEFILRTKKPPCQS